MIEYAIKQKLLARTQLKALVSNRIYYPHLPQDVIYPCVNLFLISGFRHNDVDIGYPVYQIDGFGSSYAQVIEVMREVKNAVNKQGGIWSGYNVINMILLNELDIDEPSDSSLFHRSADYKIIYKDI